MDQSRTRLQEGGDAGKWEGRREVTIRSKDYTEPKHPHHFAHMPCAFAFASSNFWLAFCSRLFAACCTSWDFSSWSTVCFPASFAALVKYTFGMLSSVFFVVIAGELPGWWCCISGWWTSWVCDILKRFEGTERSSTTENVWWGLWGMKMGGKNKVSKRSSSNCTFYRAQNEIFLRSTIRGFALNPRLIWWFFDRWSATFCAFYRSSFQFALKMIQDHVEPEGPFETELRTYWMFTTNRHLF